MRDAACQCIFLFDAILTYCCQVPRDSVNRTEGIGVKEIVTRCGYRCDICPAFAPNIKTEEDARKVCEGFHTYYGFQLDPGKVACVGCLNEGRHIDADCPVRPCVLEKELESCAQCSCFETCDKLKSRMDFLEPLPEKLKGIPAGDFRNFVVPYQSKPRMCELRKAFLRSRGS
jgi:hypothetical protein